MKESCEASSSQIKSNCFVDLLLHLSSWQALWETSSWSYILLGFDKDKLCAVREKGEHFLDYSPNKEPEEVWFPSPVLEQVSPALKGPQVFCVAQDTRAVHLKRRLFCPGFREKSLVNNLVILGEECAGDTGWRFMGWNPPSLCESQLSSWWISGVLPSWFVPQCPHLEHRYNSSTSVEHMKRKCKTFWVVLATRLALN